MDLETKWACLVKYMVLNIAAALNDGKAFLYRHSWVLEKLGAVERKEQGSLAVWQLEKNHLCGDLSTCIPNEGSRDSKINESII